MGKPSKIISKPHWLKSELPGGVRYKQVRAAVNGHHLSTVCQEARCPNLGECWNSGTATFMILGNTCTRGCRFCAVHHGGGDGTVDAAEPKQVAEAVHRMNLDYAVLTSVTRDDLPDGGAAQFAATITAIQQNKSDMLVEVLTPDYRGASLQTVVAAGPTVFAHNIEVVERLSPRMRHERFSYDASLATLAEALTYDANLVTKSSIMLGLGETRDEVLQSMRQLREVGVRVLVLGQYLQPTCQHAAVEHYVSPDEFNEFAAEGHTMGFDFIAAAPLARTSYKAAEAFVKSVHGKQK